MRLIEIRQDLFKVTRDYYLAHCISGDYALGAGIAKTFNEKYDMRAKLHKKYPFQKDEESKRVGSSLVIDNIFNLVTKARYYQKPLYKDLYSALLDMRRECENLGVTKLAMPKIGCGLDKLEWQNVRQLIEYAFGDMDIEIFVCEI